jgi:hypothetical protein
MNDNSPPFLISAHLTALNPSAKGSGGIWCASEITNGVVSGIIFDTVGNRFGAQHRRVGDLDTCAEEYDVVSNQKEAGVLSAGFAFVPLWISL